MSSLLFIGGTGFLGQCFFDSINKKKFSNLKLKKILVVSRKKKFLNSSNYIQDINGFKNFKKLLSEKHKKTKILFTSSGAVYGKSSKKIKFKETNRISKTKINKLKGYKINYAKSKIFIEKGFQKLGQKGFKVVIARLFTFIGKKILNNKNYAIADIIDQAKNPKKKKILLSSTNEVYRGYMNVDDLIIWIVKIMIHSNKNCEIYNVGSDEVVSIKKLAGIISSKYKKDLYFANKSIPDRSSDFYVPSIDKAKKRLKLKIKIKLKESIKQL